MNKAVVMHQQDEMWTGNRTRSTAQLSLTAVPPLGGPTLACAVPPLGVPPSPVRRSGTESGKEKWE